MREAERSAEFVDFVRAHREDLLRTARLLCVGDEHFAEDVVQTTLTRLYLAWGRVRRATSPIAYARRTLTHAFIDETRRAHRRRERTSADPAHIAGVVHPTASLGDPELRQVVLQALDSLGARQRAVVVLRHVHDLDVAETAAMLGCSVGTVKSQNARALERLRQVLGRSLDVPTAALILAETGGS